MPDEINQPPVPQVDPQQHGILDKTLGEILQGNPQAQNLVMKAMHIDAAQLQKMVQSTGDNQLMNMKIRDMFSSGIMQQAASGKITPQMMQGQAVQVTPEQMQQILNTMPNGQMTPEQFQQITGQSLPAGQAVQVAQTVPQKQSLLDKLKGFFK